MRSSRLSRLLSRPGRMAALQGSRMKKDESFLGKLGGTLARKKKAREVTDLQEEGKNAINAPMSPTPIDVHPEDTLLEENEERTMIDPNSKEDAKFKELVKVLIDWINEVLVEERIIVKNLEEDFYDGQVLQKLLEKLANRKLSVAEVTQSEIAQKQKLQTILEDIQEFLRPQGWAIRWNVDSIHGKNLVAILHLLVALAMHFRAPIRLPEHVCVQVVVVKKREGILQTAHVTEELTTTTELMMGRFERDAFDTLFDHAPDKLSVVKKSLITFVNKHLNKLNLEVTELETQFADGVYLVLLMGLLENYFVPLHNFFLTPEEFEQKVHNISFSFELMQDAGLKKPKARPEAQMDVTSQYGDSQMLCSMETQGEARKLLQPNMENDPRLQELKKFLIDWINYELQQEHIVMKSLEEDVFDGLILHHLLQKVGHITLEVEEITLSANNQKRKLGVILEAVSQCLQLEESQLKWSVDLIHSKDLLATLHLLIALSRHFRPDLTLPANVSVEVVVVEPTRSGMRTGKAIECLTGAREEDAAPKKDAFDHLFDMSPDKINDVKQAIVNFVNKQLVNLSLTVTDLDSQFADGVILLLLIGQVEGYFLNLSSFFLCPQSTEDKLHNVTLALDLLKDGGILQNAVDPAEIVNRDLKATLRVLYSLLLKHKNTPKSS